MVGVRGDGSQWRRDWDAVLAVGIQARGEEQLLRAREINSISDSFTRHGSVHKRCLLQYNNCKLNTHTHTPTILATAVDSNLCSRQLYFSHCRVACFASSDMCAQQYTYHILGYSSKQTPQDVVSQIEMSTCLAEISILAVITGNC